MSQDIILPPIVLTLAGADPTSGAGIQADILTLASMGCHPLSVITAITVQDTRGVQDFMVIDDEWVLDQARAVLEDMPVAAFKVGMIGSIDNVVAIAELIADYPDIPLIYDPVLASGAGDELSREDMIHVLRDMLLPLIFLVGLTFGALGLIVTALAVLSSSLFETGGGNPLYRLAIFVVVVIALLVRYF